MVFTQNGLGPFQEYPCYNSQSSDFALYFEEYFMCVHYTFGLSFSIDFEVNTEE